MSEETPVEVAAEVAPSTETPAAEAAPAESSAPAPEAAPAEAAPAEAAPAEATPSETPSEPATAPEASRPAAGAGAARGSVSLGGGGFTCAICSKISFPAETIQFEQRTFHGECFRCKTCNKKMEGGAQAATYEGTIYCRQCFEREGLHLKQRSVKWTPKATGAPAKASKFGGGGTQCTVCGKTSFAGETVQFEMKPYHNSCFKCTECTKDLKASETGAYEGKLYCTRCFEKNNFHRKQAEVKWTKKAEGTRTAGSFGGGGVPCVVCNATVFSGEALQYDMKTYHQKCFKCTECTNEVKQSDAGKYEEKIYCSRCFAAGGFARKQAAVKWTPKTTTGTAAPSRFGGGGQACTACNTTVYSSEAVSYDMKIYHVKCLACSECKKECKQSEVAKFADVLYCQRCFEKNGLHLKQAQVKFAPKAASATSPAASRFGGGGAKCVVCAKTVYPAETIQYEGKPYHSKCFACSACNKELAVGAAEYNSGSIYCKKCFMERGLHQARVTTRPAAAAGAGAETPAAEAPPS